MYLSFQGKCFSSVYLIGRIVSQPLRTLCDVNGYCDGNGECIQHVDQEHKAPQDSFYAVITWIGTKW